MTLLQVRDFPQDLYERLSGLAAQERRSIAQQTVVLLRESLNDGAAASHRMEALARAVGLAASTPAAALDPVRLIREDRER